MTTASYFRQHAESCLTFARTTTDRDTAAKLFELAGECMAKADELDELKIAPSRWPKITRSGVDRRWATIHSIRSPEL